jgi:hypothetical protein
MVSVSCHLLEDGGVLFRIEDTGLGIAREKVPRLNAAFAGPVPDVNESTARHTGFPVVHRIARKHSIGVRFASRRRPGTGTLAMVTVPPQLLCAITAQDTPHRTAAAEPSAPWPTATAAPDLPRREQAPPTLAPPTQLLPAQAASPEAALPEAASPQVAPAEVVPPEVVAPEAVSTEPDQDQDARPSELPRREPLGARGDEPRLPEAAAPAQPQQAAARRAFADDLSAFSQGIQDALAARGITGSVVSAMFNGAPIEEGPQS